MNPARGVKISPFYPGAAASSAAQKDPGEVIRKLKELRRGNRLPGLSLQEIQEMKEEGRG